MAAERPIELCLPVDAGEAPLGYHDADATVAVEIALAGGGYATLLLATDAARSWAGELFDAVAVAHREATGNPHALSDLEIAFLPDPDAYDPGPGLVVSEDEAGPARVRLHVAIDIEGRHLHCASLRAAVVETLAARFNTTRVAVSPGTPLAGRAGRAFLLSPPALSRHHPQQHHPTTPTNPSTHPSSPNPPLPPPSTTSASTSPKLTRTRLQPGVALAVGPAMVGRAERSAGLNGQRRTPRRAPRRSRRLAPLRRRPWAAPGCPRAGPATSAAAATCPSRPSAPQTTPSAPGDPPYTWNP